MAYTFQELAKCNKCKDYLGYEEEYLPVNYFGNNSTPVLLVSLNPSHREYKKPKNTEAPLLKLIGESRNQISKEQLKSVHLRQENYFQSGFHLDWFEPAEQFLNEINTKYWGQLSFGLNGKTSNVSNIDVVKCPTNPIWSDLGLYQTCYINNCYSYLVDQLFSDNTKVIIVNGKSVYDAINFIANTTKEFKLIRLGYSTKFQIKRNNKEVSCEIYCNRLEKSGRSVFLTGTSGRISKDGRNLFFNTSDNSLNQNANLVIDTISKLINQYS